jgi:hypothetical protein
MIFIILELRRRCWGLGRQVKRVSYTARKTSRYSILSSAIPRFPVLTQQWDFSSLPKHSGETWDKTHKIVRVPFLLRVQRWRSIAKTEMSSALGQVDYQGKVGSQSPFIIIYNSNQNKAGKCFTVVATVWLPTPSRQTKCVYLLLVIRGAHLKENQVILWWETGDHFSYRRKWLSFDRFLILFFS